MSLKRRMGRLGKRLRLSMRALTNPNDIVKSELIKALRAWGRRAPTWAGRKPPSSLIREPQWNYMELYKLGQNHFVLRRIVDSIIRECTRNGGVVEERFKSKCTLCGVEYDKEMDQCDCGGAVRMPDPMQRKMLQAFVKDPNLDDEWLDLVISILRFELTCDDWYFQVAESPSVVDLAPYGYAEKLETSVLQVYVEDSRYIRVVADEHGRLGNPDEYFCPACYDGLKADKYYDRNYFKKHKGKCKCGGNLVVTCYIWREPEANTVKARFGRKEIIHGNKSPQLPHLYGVPKPIGCLRALHITRHMARGDLEHYASGHVKKMVWVSGINQEEVNSALEDAKQQQENLVARSTRTGQRGPPQDHTLVLGVDDSQASVTVVDAMPEPEKMQDLEKKKQYIEDICAIYGVTPKFEGIAEAGKQGVRMVIDVENSVAEMYQRSVTDVLDEQLWHRLGVSDWVWRFNPVEPRDELLDARIKQLNVDTAIKAARADLKVELEESGELKVSGVPSGEYPPMAEDEGMDVKVPGEESGQTESPWKKQKGETWLVKQVGGNSQIRTVSSESKKKDRTRASN